MVRIVNMSALLPEDIVFEVNGQRYTCPGDPPVETILRLVDLFSRAQDQAGDDAEQAEVGIQTLRALNDEVLGLLRVRAPELERSPFGLHGIIAFVAQLMAAYDVQAGEDPTRPQTKGKRPPKRSS